LLLYDSIQSHISYSAIIWAAILNNNLKKIHIIQKRVLRLVVQSSKRAPSKPIFKKLQRLTFFDIHKMQVTQFMFQNLNGGIPNLFINYFQKIPSSFPLHKIIFQTSP